MIPSRIEVNEMGEFYFVIPEDIVEDLLLEEGELVSIDLKEGMLEVYFGG
jgi:hypothetical protein